MDAWGSLARRARGSGRRIAAWWRPAAAPARQAEAEAEVDQGRLIYQRDCAFCHGANGEGTPTRGPSLQGVGAAEVDYAVSTGRMPVDEPGQERERRPSKYTAGQRRALLAFLDPVIAGGPSIPLVDPAQGDRRRGAGLGAVTAVVAIAAWTWRTAEDLR